MTPHFKAEDVWAVARVVASNPTYHEESYSKNSYIKCRFCDGSYNEWRWREDEMTPDQFPHDLSCPVLIARDLLTGASV